MNTFTDDLLTGIRSEVHELRKHIRRTGDAEHVAALDHGAEVLTEKVDALDAALAEGNALPTAWVKPAELEIVLDIVARNGTPFRVVYLPSGMSVGRPAANKYNRDRKPLVEFYDRRYEHTCYGQFVSCYNADTLLTPTGDLNTLEYAAGALAAAIEEGEVEAIGPAAAHVKMFLLTGATEMGLDLNTDVDAWTVDGTTMATVRAWLRNCEAGRIMREEI